jgi:hypothetical protein
MHLHLKILLHPAARSGERASILVAAGAAAILLQECLRGKGTPGWSGIMLLGQQWMPPLLPLLRHPPLLPLMLPTPRLAGARWRLVDDRPHELPVFPPTAAATAIAAATSSADLSSAVRFAASASATTSTAAASAATSTAGCWMKLAMAAEVEMVVMTLTATKRQMASMTAERGRLRMEHNNQPDG